MGPEREQRASELAAAAAAAAIAGTEAACVDLEREGKALDTLRFAFPEHDSAPALSSARVCFWCLLESSCKEWRERERGERRKGERGWEWRRSERKGVETER